MAMPILVLAAPGIPHQFYGTAQYTNGTDISSGNVIVKIGTTQVATVPIASGKYGYNPNLLMVTDPDSDRAGSTLKFFIGAVDTGATKVFVNGAYNQLNLTIPVPSDTVIGSDADVSLTSDTEGEANLPTGAKNVVLTDSTVMDLSSGLVGGKVTLRSGVSGQPVVLTNSNLSKASASIPDGTKITGPTGWDGKITPPVSGTPSGGTAPAGFSVGGTVISIGSSSGTLVFDKAVTILLEGVTGAVGYRPAGSNTWTQITNVCASPYATPGNPPANSECAISNGTDTKIATYHFTSFGSLTANPDTGGNGGGGGGGGGGSTPVTTPASPLSAAAQKVDANKDGKIDIFDFNALMINWGKTGTGNSADFNSDGKIDIFDFNLLMINWTL